MNLGRSFLRPGTIVEVIDKKGTIRATSPGLFSVEDNYELLPPIIPWFQGASSSYSSPLIGDKVWILHDNNNSQLFYYLRFNKLDDSILKLLENSNNTEVIFSRDTDNGLYQIYFSDGTGIKILRDGSYICISPEGNIDIVTENNRRSISLSDDSICLGEKAENASSVSTHVAYGEKVEDCLNTIYNILKQLQIISEGNPYTSHLRLSFNSLSQLESQISKITSKDVRVI